MKKITLGFVSILLISKSLMADCESYVSMSQSELDQRIEIELGKKSDYTTKNVGNHNVRINKQAAVIEQCKDLWILNHINYIDTTDSLAALLRLSKKSLSGADEKIYGGAINKSISHYKTISKETSVVGDKSFSKKPLVFLGAEQINSESVYLQEVRLNRNNQLSLKENHMKIDELKNHLCTNQNSPYFKLIKEEAKLNIECKKTTVTEYSNISNNEKNDQGYDPLNYNGIYKFDKLTDKPLPVKNITGSVSDVLNSKSILHVVLRDKNNIHFMMPPRKEMFVIELKLFDRYSEKLLSLP